MTSGGRLSTRATSTHRPSCRANVRCCPRQMAWRDFPRTKSSVRWETAQEACCCFSECRALSHVRLPRERLRRCCHSVRSTVLNYIYNYSYIYCKIRPCFCQPLNFPYLVHPISGPQNKIGPRARGNAVHLIFMGLAKIQGSTIQNTVLYKIQNNTCNT